MRMVSQTLIVSMETKTVTSVKNELTAAVKVWLIIWRRVSTSLV